MIPKSIVLLLSGGLDSVTLLHLLKSEGHSVHAALCDYKQPHSQELNLARLHCHRLGVLYTTIEIPYLGGLDESSAWIVPCRNPILISLAVNVAIRANAECVAFGANADDAAGFPDCRPEFVKAMNSALKAAEIKVEIVAPLLDWPKWKIGALAREMGIKAHEIWSCYRAGLKPCGICPACLKLEAALK